jgi:membrane protease subunit (stomatin/prohibitin family)
MAIIDVLKYDGPNNVLVWKWRSASNESREEELRYGSQLVVNQSQEACFIKGGALLDVFGPGTHTLSSKNLPILPGIIGLAFGGDSPFKAEVYFINKSVSMDAKFGLMPFNMTEPKFLTPIPVNCRGSFALSVSDCKVFLNKIVGTVPDLETNTLTKYFRGVINETTKTAITRIAKEQEKSPFELESIVSDVSTSVKDLLFNTFNVFGLKLELFNIEAIPVIDDDPNVKTTRDEFRRIKIADTEEKERLARRGENLDVFKAEESFKTQQEIAKNMGSGTGEGSSLMAMIIQMQIAGQMAIQMKDALNTTQSTNSISNQLNSNLNNTTPLELFREIVLRIDQIANLHTSEKISEEELVFMKKELLNKLR